MTQNSQKNAKTTPGTKAEPRAKGANAKGASKGENAKAEGSVKADRATLAQAKTAKFDKILRAAVKIFAKNGFHNAKISEIAKEAGVADGTIYLYFKNKDDLLIQLFEQQIGVAMAHAKDVLAGETEPARRLEAFVVAYLRYMEKHKNLAEVLSVELRQSHKFMKEYVPIKFAEFLKVIGEIIEDGVVAGVFRADADSHVLRRAIFGAIDELVLAAVLARRPPFSADDAARALSALFLDGLLARK
ncbi:TetR/AcrR family transcriptional regulator [bacterium]|nr:TetR/AcrR family transcriptional regulator [bacterium]